MVTSTKIQYLPRIGQRVKLNTFTDYTSRDLPVWSWLIVTEIMPDTGHIFATLHDTSKADKHFGEQLHIALSAIQKPIGWREVYTICCQPDKLDEVLTWLPRGIVVRRSQYIGDCSIVFQPADNAEQPHWKFGEVTDIVPAEQVNERIRVIKHEYVYDAFVSETCRYCKGKAIRPHGPEDAYQGEVQDCRYCKDGMGARYLSEMGKPVRKAAIKALHEQGWSVMYSRHGSHWFMERETVVKEVSEVNQ